MPSQATLDAFVDMVGSNRHLEAVETFYLEDAWTRENLAEPLQGRNAILAREANAIASVKAIDTKPPLVVVSQGDQTVIRWVFEIVDASGERRSLEELTLITWRGERIVSEEFFYDSVTAWRTCPLKG